MRSELERIRQQVADDLVDPVDVPLDFIGQARAPLDPEPDLALDGQHVEGVFKVVEQLLERHGAKLEAAAARLEPTDVEELPDQPGERVRLRVQGFQYIPF